MEHSPEKVDVKVKRSYLGLLYFTLLFLSCNLSAQNRYAVITVAGDHNFPPYEFLNDNGEPDGYNTELTLAIAKVMGIKVRIELRSWDDVKQALKEGKVDILQGISNSSARSQIFTFSPPHSIIQESVFARKGASAIESIKDLIGKEVIVQTGGIMYEQLKAANLGLHLIGVDTHVEALRLLASGEHDYAFVANLPGLYVGRELLLSNIEPIGAPLGQQKYGYATQKGNEELLAQFSEGLAILRNTGKQQAIYNKWFGPLLKKSPDWEKIGLSAGILSLLLTLIIGGVMIWNRSLAKQVARRTRRLALQQQQLVQADKMTSLGILISGIGHEINNPAGLLSLNLPVLKEAFDDLEDILDEYYQEHGDFYMAGLSYSRIRDEIPLMLDDMIEGTQHIRRIVNDLRDFARHEPLNLQEYVDLNQVVMAAIRMTDNTIRSSTQVFSVSYYKNLPKFKGNAQRLLQVIINLIVNACQALESIEQAINIHTFYDETTQMICLKVKDKGKGIEEEHLSRLRDPFFTTKREQGGTGLGLSISSSIVKEHGGHLDFASKIGEGTCVSLYLPIIREEK